MITDWGVGTVRWFQHGQIFSSFQEISVGFSSHCILSVLKFLIYHTLCLLINLACAPGLPSAGRPLAGYVWWDGWLSGKATLATGRSANSALALANTAAGHWDNSAYSTLPTRSDWMKLICIKPLQAGAEPVSTQYSPKHNRRNESASHTGSHRPRRGPGWATQDGVRERRWQSVSLKCEVYLMIM